MKILFSLFLLTSFAGAQTLTVEEQKQLIDENKMLREEIKKRDANSENSEKIMEALKRGQKFQEEQNKALEELDKED